MSLDHMHSVAMISFSCMHSSADDLFVACAVLPRPAKHMTFNDLGDFVKLFQGTTPKIKTHDEQASWYAPLQKTSSSS